MPKVLVADDSIAVRKVAERLLTEAGLGVTLAANGEEALAFLSKEVPDLIVSDVIMPDKSGYEVCAFVRGQAALKNTPVLLISGIVNDEVTKQADSCHADGVLEKAISRHVPERPRVGTPWQEAKAACCSACTCQTGRPACALKLIRLRRIQRRYLIRTVGMSLARLLDEAQTGRRGTQKRTPSICAIDATSVSTRGSSRSRQRPGGPSRAGQRPRGSGKPDQGTGSTSRDASKSWKYRLGASRSSNHCWPSNVSRPHKGKRPRANWPMPLNG